ncbi:protein of unknown function [Methylorubrum extorquens DM4]|uniref:Uncharacterized protein n=1 Tax=Methylorubrum extorquens (strain DSM 6343 / CIP 106787 / DM4) TaxID=661410 RepID=C7CDM9_METED|nr:protein of unknown function [Methylorubrum extorquens DM4]
MPSAAVRAGNAATVILGTGGDERHAGADPSGAARGGARLALGWSTRRTVVWLAVKAFGLCLAARGKGADTIDDAW